MKTGLLGLLASGLILAFSASAQAGAITVDAGWYGFCFGGVGSGATAGCQNSGVGVSGNSTTFTASGNVLFNVTDAFSYGDQFEVIINGTSYFTSNVPSSSGSQSNPDLAFLDPGYSKLSVLLGAGAYTVDIMTTASPFGSGGAYLQAITATAVPEPLTLSLFGAGVAGAAALRRRKKA